VMGNIIAPYLSEPEVSVPEEDQPTKMQIEQRVKAEKKREKQSDSVRLFDDQILDLQGLPKNRYEVMVSLLSEPISSVERLIEIMAVFLRATDDGMTLDAAKQFLQGLEFYLNSIEESLKAEHFRIINKIQRLALEARKAVPYLPYLLQDEAKTITLSKYQIQCMVACSFFSLWPEQVPKSDPIMANPNMHKIFQPFDDTLPIYQQAKVRCFLNYFARNVPKDQYVSFTRCVLTTSVDWANSTAPLRSIKVYFSGGMQDLPHATQVDFANMSLGGGVFGKGAVQEEILFTLAPEHTVSMLFTPVLKDNEAFLFRGAERYSSIKGYGRKMEWGDNFVDPVLLGSNSHKDTDGVAIDATQFHVKEDQWKLESILRETNKAYAGFVHCKDKPIATGNWGCGVFGGHPQLKALLQWMAASEADKDLEYCAFNTESVCQPLVEIHQKLVDKKMTVGQLFQLVVKLGVTETPFEDILKQLDGEPAGQTETDMEVEPATDSK